jgi:hypothetical protein
MVSAIRLTVLLSFEYPRSALEVMTARKKSSEVQCEILQQANPLFSILRVPISTNDRTISIDSIFVHDLEADQQRTH